MGKNKNSRKIRSGNKRVRVALSRQKALHAIRITQMAAVFNATLGMIKMQRMAKSAIASGGVIGPNLVGEAVLSIEELKGIRDSEIRNPTGGTKDAEA
jgi:hypothetical protein